MIILIDSFNQQLKQSRLTSVNVRSLSGIS